MTTTRLSPAAFAACVQDIKQGLDELVKEYAICDERAHTTQVTDQAHVSAGPSNVPYALADAHRKLRSELRYASEFVRLFLHGRPNPNRFYGVLDQVDVLRARLEMDEQRHGGLFEEPTGPVVAFKADVEEAVEAQERRRGRGDIHSGDQAEVRDRLRMVDLEQEFRPRKGTR